MASERAPATRPKGPARVVTSRATIERAIAAMDATGHQVKAARICANGDVLLLTESPAHLLPSNDVGVGDWVDLAGETEIPRA